MLLIPWIWRYRTIPNALTMNPLFTRRERHLRSCRTRRKGRIVQALEAAMINIQSIISARMIDFIIWHPIRIEWIPRFTRDVITWRTYRPSLERSNFHGRCPNNLWISWKQNIAPVITNYISKYLDCGWPYVFSLYDFRGQHDASIASLQLKNYAWYIKMDVMTYWLYFACRTSGWAIEKMWQHKYM